MNDVGTGIEMRKRHRVPDAYSACAAFVHVLTHQYTSRVLQSLKTHLNEVAYFVLGVFGLPVTLPVSYTSVIRVKDAYPPISSVSNITSGVVAQYAGDVESEINARIASRYTLPLTVDCPLITAIATRETIYRLAVQRLLVQFPPAQQGTHPLQVQHRDDQKLLESIMLGSLKLVDSSGVQISAETTQMDVYSTTQNYTPTFHEGAWQDMVQDPDKLDDIKTDRDL